MCMQVNGCVSVRVCERKKKKTERKRLWRQSRSGTLNYAKRIAFFMFIVSHFTFNFFLHSLAFDSYSSIRMSVCVAGMWSQCLSGSNDVCKCMPFGFAKFLQLVWCFFSLYTIFFFSCYYFHCSYFAICVHSHVCVRLFFVCSSLIMRLILWFCVAFSRLAMCRTIPQKHKLNVKRIQHKPTANA